MLEYLNANPALTELISLLVTTLVAVIGFFVTNKNITKIHHTQNQSAGNGSKQYQAQNDSKIHLGGNS